MADTSIIVLALFFLPWYDYCGTIFVTLGENDFDIAT